MYYILHFIDTRTKFEYSKYPMSMDMDTNFENSIYIDVGMRIIFKNKYKYEYSYTFPESVPSPYLGSALTETLSSF